MATKTATIELYRNDMKFSAAHFTIFNAHERERLHGHNYYVKTRITAEYVEPGITYDYSDTRKKILALCRSLNEYLLLPANSPYLTISEKDDNYLVRYGEDNMQFLKSDTLLLPLENITGEELSHWFIAQLFEDEADLRAKKIHQVKISVSTTNGQEAWASQELA